MDNLIFQTEKLSDIYDEMIPILYEHYKEISHYQDIKLEPNLREYFKLENLGILKIYTVREEKELIGYAIFFVKHNIHYKSSLQANQDIIYIRKDRRGFGRKFIKWCDERLKELGVQVVYQHIKHAHDWSPILEKMGYEKQDIILSKRLDK